MQAHQIPTLSSMVDQLAIVTAVQLVFVVIGALMKYTNRRQLTTVTTQPVIKVRQTPIFFPVDIRSVINLGSGNSKAARSSAMLIGAKAIT